ncbi:kinase-like protein [Epithele typhae]|uniref:kinase-like protein n=1 Tax=Epithele typhae TaxID=378194 RepID=UPI0020083774|nr:kinase-like protein [Epithele typhae]KAH9932759.1 kinase-like protein [Epithele typhae]
MFLSVFSPTHSERSLAPDDEGATVAGYTLGPVVGHGGFSIIRTASSPQGGTVAVKIVKRADLDKQPNPTQARKSLDREADTWASLNHEHILPLFTVTHTPHADFFFTAYCPAGSLFDILKRDGRPALPQDDAGMMFRQVVRGLRYMHEAGFVHGDMKLENVLVDDMGVCKICDFGMTRQIGEEVDCGHLAQDDGDAEREKKYGGPQRARTISQAHTPAHRPLGHQAGASATVPNRGFAQGSLPYAAPELLHSPSSTTSYVAHPAQDVWALGVMLYTLLTGKLPFSDSFEPRLQMKILRGVFEMPLGIGRSAEQVLHGCIERSVADRWTVAMVDELAWGIGWGSATDDVSPPPEAIRASRSTSRSKPRQEHIVEDRDTRRSASRSASHASRSRSAARHRSTSRTPAHHPYENAYHNPLHPHPLLKTDSHPAQPHPLPTQPSFSSLTQAILRTSSSSSESSSVHDSAIVMQPLSPCSTTYSVLSDRAHRGRLPRPRVHTVEDISLSRSRSPHSEMPMTPKDVSLDAPRRRRPKSPAAHMQLRSEDLNTLDEDDIAQWSLASDTAGPVSRGRRADSGPRDRRNESMPPVLDAGRASAWTNSPSKSALATPATPIPIPGIGAGARSKSLGRR